MLLGDDDVIAPHKQSGKYEDWYTSYVGDVLELTLGQEVRTPLLKQNIRHLIFVFRPANTKSANTSSVRQVLQTFLPISRDYGIAYLLRDFVCICCYIGKCF